MKLWYDGGFSWLLLLLALLVLTSPSSFPQGTAPTPLSPQQTQSIETLKGNLTRALALCETLQRDLQLRIASYQQLQTLYDALEATRQRLDAQVASLQDSLSSSEAQLTQAQADLQTTRDLSDRLSSSLKAASQSLADYKRQADKAVLNLEIQRGAWETAAFVGIGATGGALVGELSAKDFKGTLLGAGIGAATGLAAKLIKDLSRLF